jgi:integrase
MLTDTAVKQAKPTTKIQRLFDYEGLYVEIQPSGSKRWNMKYRFQGRETRVALGQYPHVTLAEARKRRDAARKLLAEGKNPSAEKKAQKTAIAAPSTPTFEAIAREWYEVRKSGWAASYAVKIEQRFERDVFPWIGQRPVTAITPPELLEVLRRIEGRGVVETAHRALENCNQVFRYAISTGRAETSPARDLKDALKKPVATHFAAVTEPKRLGQVLRAMRGYQGTPVVSAALKLAPMVLLRPGELRHASWDEFNLDTGLWTVPAMRMKRELQGKLHGEPHLVPLATQAVEVLRALADALGVKPGEAKGFVFRGERHHDRPMSENTINAALRAMGFNADEVTAHGFRATARTMLVEQLGVDADVVEAQLAHAVKDSLGRAYNRTTFLQQRTGMMQRWADYLDTLARDLQ